MTSAPPSGAAAALARLEPRGVQLGLDSFRELLARLGDPQERVPAVLVAGTNGKGSCAAAIAAAAAAAGYRCALYTSPHLEEPRERLRIGGVAIEDADLAALLAEVERGAGSSGPTAFEALTAAAFLWFARSEVELAVLEVGLGGRLDATNACEPLLGLVTGIDLDHGELLGRTLAEVAREKAGISRSGVPFLFSAAAPEASEALGETASRRGALVHRGPDEVRLERAEPSDPAAWWRGQELLVATPEGRYELTTPLVGRQLAENLALAVRGCELLRAAGFPRLAPDAISAGLARCRWPGRMEAVSRPDGGGVLLDGGHNPAAAAALASVLDERGIVPDLLFGCLADKDAAAMLPPLAQRSRRIWLTAPDSGRARPPTELLALLPAGRASIRPTVSDALGAASTEGEAPWLLVTGSLYLVGEARAALRERRGEPPPAAGPLWSTDAATGDPAVRGPAAPGDARRPPSG